MIGQLRLVAFGVCVAACAGELNVVYEWGSNINLWTGRREHDERNATAAMEDYVPGNNLVHRMRIWDGAMYVAVPRFKRGVPATLCKSHREPDGGTTLKPFPTIRMQDVGDCFGVQNAKDIEIDHLGQLWTLDAGEVYDLQRTADAPDYTCDPKLLVVNISSGAVLRSAVVPSSMHTAGRTVLSGLSVDLKTLTAVVADVSADNPGFLVYGLRSGVYRKFRCKRLRPADAAANGYNEALLAISPIDNMLYFTTVELDNVFAIPLSVFDVPATRLLADTYDVSHYANDLGPKADTVTAMILDSVGRLYMGMPRAIVSWDTLRGGFDVKQLYAQDDRLQWISSFAFDPDGYLWIVSSAFRDFVDIGSDGHGPADVKIFKSHCGATAFALLTAAGSTGRSPDAVSSVKTVTAAAPLLHYVFATLAIQITFARRTVANDR
uniref:Major royal jelly protein 4 n=1 Tax=Sipha flava TaxID=143950 RepID=A0A2S2PVS3_9HEMI